MGVELPLRVVVTILECCVTFSKVKLSIRSFVLFQYEQEKGGKDFIQDFSKLMNNSIFGETMENLRKRVDVRLVTDVNQFIKLTSKPTFV